jgi:hypothetical protein
LPTPVYTAAQVKALRQTGRKRIFEEKPGAGPRPAPTSQSLGVARGRGRARCLGNLPIMRSSVFPECWSLPLRCEECLIKNPIHELGDPWFFALSRSGNIQCIDNVVLEKALQPASRVGIHSGDMNQRLTMFAGELYGFQ